MAELHLPHAGHAHAPDENPDVHHEATDVNITAILSFAAGLIVFAIVIHLLVWVLFRFFDASTTTRTARAYPLAAQQGNRLPPEPRLQTNPRGDLQNLRSAEDATLTTYGWVDKNAGVVRIPIDQAMKLAIERGLPAREKQ